MRAGNRASLDGGEPTLLSGRRGKGKPGGDGNTTHSQETEQ